MSTKENTQNRYAQGCQEVQKAGGNNDISIYAYIVFTETYFFQLANFCTSNNVHVNWHFMKQILIC